MTKAIFLTNGYTDPVWFHRLAKVSIVCFTEGRIQFINGGESNRNGQVFFYIGPNKEKFIETFSAFGTVMAPMERSNPKPVVEPKVVDGDTEMANYMDAYMAWVEEEIVPWARNWTPYDEFGELFIEAVRFLYTSESSCDIGFYHFDGLLTEYQVSRIMNIADWLAGDMETQARYAVTLLGSTDFVYSHEKKKHIAVPNKEFWQRFYDGKPYEPPEWVRKGEI